MNRALPGWCIDAIRDGVKTSDLRRRGDLAVHAAVNRVCLSALNLGWTLPALDALIFALDPKHGYGRLGEQLCQRHGAPLSRTEGRKRLRRIWDDAQKWLGDQPGWASAAEAKRRADALLDLAADAEVQLPERERAVLCYAAQVAQELGLCRIALAERQVGAATGLTRTQARHTLQRLDEDGLLPLHSHGRGCVGCPANLYTLPDVHKTALTQHDHSAGCIRQPGHAGVCLRHRPDRNATMPDDRIMVQVRVRPGETVTDALRRTLAERDAITASAAPDEPLPENVRPIRRREL
jgi:hypothetical protein